MMLFGGMSALVLTCRRADRQMSRHVGCVSAKGAKCHDMSQTFRQPDLRQMSQRLSLCKRNLSRRLYLGLKIYENRKASREHRPGQGKAAPLQFSTYEHRERPPHVQLLFFDNADTAGVKTSMQSELRRARLRSTRRTAPTHVLHAVPRAS